jgi:hypothetical protein
MSVETILVAEEYIAVLQFLLEGQTLIIIKSVMYWAGTQQQQYQQQQQQ